MKKASGSVGGVPDFVDLGDTPSALAPIAGRSIMVNSAGTALEGITLTKQAVGLDNVDNTSDADKPISSATQTALDGKLAISTYNSDKVDWDKVVSDTAGITNEAADGTYPLRLQTDKVMYLVDTEEQTIATSHNQTFTTVKLVNDLLANQQIGSY
jgi:hypothetical protein